MATVQPIPTRLPYWALFIPYLIAPIALLIIFGIYAFDWNVRLYLPTSLSQIVILGIFFENPHILASSLLLADKEYLQYYRRKLILTLSITATIVAAAWLAFGSSGFYILYFIWTIYHVVRQQLGIGKMMNRQALRLYEVWSWVFIMTALFVAYGIGYVQPLRPTIVGGNIELYIYGAAIASSLLGAFIMTRLNQPIGRYYVGANLAMLWAIVACFAAGLPLFVVLVPRVIHDATAFMIYLNHDLNRNRPKPKEYLYKLTAGLLPIGPALLIVAFAWGGFLTFSGIEALIPVAITLTLIHYTTEAFTWKADGLHRKYLHVALPNMRAPAQP